MCGVLGIIPIKLDRTEETAREIMGNPSVLAIVLVQQRRWCRIALIEPPGD